ncbi:VOC family protein [Dyadobacter sp. 3J3]|uniref:VOC family protein n=1 Tax=Dyadobacter sp. 3J3 TaxID=2606600 RepID=UPI001359A97A|nr:VOC family protein [Dyadobacter sp. 3J3]
MEEKHPTFANGKICYIEIPSDDIHVSSAFYETVFGWIIRRRDDGSVSFDDGAGEVSGTWITGKKAGTGIGMMISIMINDIHAIMELITQNGGKITEPVGKYDPEITAQFSDPFGNLWGLYQHRKD